MARERDSAAPVALASSMAKTPRRLRVVEPPPPPAFPPDEDDAEAAAFDVLIPFSMYGGDEE